MRQCSASAATSPAPMPLGDRDRLVDRGEPLGRVLDVEQRGVAAHQRGGERARRRRPRRAIATASAPSRAGRSLGVGEREVLGEAREQPRPQRALGVPERGERLLEPRDVRGVGGDRHVEAPAGARARRGRGSRGRGRRATASSNAARAPGSLACQRTSPRAMRRSARRSTCERLPEVPGRLLVGVRRDRVAGGGGAVLDRGLRPADLAGGEEVVGELAGRGAGGLERAAGAQVQARAAGVGGRVVERLAHERVGEREAVDLLGVLAHDAGAQRLLERVEQLLPGPPHHRLERGEAEVAAEHRGGGQRLDGLRLEPREPARDQVLDALGHALGLGRLGQAAQHLLDEERVAGGAAVEAARELRVADELRGVRLLAARRARSARPRARG